MYNTYTLRIWRTIFLTSTLKFCKNICKIKIGFNAIHLLHAVFTIKIMLLTKADTLHNTFFFLPNSAVWQLITLVRKRSICQARRGPILMASTSKNVYSTRPELIFPAIREATRMLFFSLSPPTSCPGVYFDFLYARSPEKE